MACLVHSLEHVPLPTFLQSALELLRIATHKSHFAGCRAPPAATEMTGARINP